MKSMVYYPGFEVQNEKWLKFALLYFEELRPIIPDMLISKNRYLSQTAIKIMQDTDLILPYRPDFPEIDSASTLACEEFDKYLTHPQRYGSMFRRYGKAAPVEMWKRSDSQICNLYNGKFTNIFYDYCIKNGLAHSFEYGIKISKDLAFIYMSLLADIISKHQEMEMFTDTDQYNLFLLRKDGCILKDQKIRYKIIKTQMEFLIPAKIESIPMETIIRLRNSENFDSLRRAYVEEMEKYLKKREEIPDCSFDEQLEIKQELKKILELTCNATAAVFLSCSTIASLIEETVSPMQALASAYLNFSAAKRACALSQYIKDIGNKIQAKRYVGQLRRAYQGKRKPIKTE